MSHSDVFKIFSVKVSPMWFVGPWRYGNVMTWWYEGRVATDMRIWGCSTCQNKGPPHLLLDIAQLIPQLVLFSILSHPLSSTFGILRLRHISDKFRNQLIVYYQYWAIEMISIPKRNSSLTFWKVTVWHKYEGQYRCNTSGEMWIVTKLGWKAPKLSTFDLSNTINFWKSHWVTVSLCDMNMKGNIVTKWQTL